MNQIQINLQKGNIAAKKMRELKNVRFLFISFCAMKTTLVILMKRNRTNYRNENDLCSHSDYGQSMNHDQLYKAPACLYTYHHPTCTGNLSYLFYLVKNQVS